MRRGRAGLSVLVAAAVVSSGCVRVLHETRVERGPVIRAFEREVPAGPGGVMAKVEVRYPGLVLAFQSYELCRQERVEEVVEEEVTESSAPSAGPAFALGVSGTVAGGALLGLRGAFSNEPDSRRIDVDGRYGPTPRTVAVTWGYVLLAVGIPALVTGIVGLRQSGEKVEGRRVEQVASAMEVPCQTAPADGEVTLERASGEEPLKLKTEGGAVALDAQAAGELRLGSLHLDGRPVLVPEEDGLALEAFFSCGEALPPPEADALAALGERELVARYNAARRCAQVAPEAAGKAVRALEQEIHQRRGGAPGPVGGAPRTFDDAVAAWPPSVRLEPGHADLAKLGDVDRIAGRTVLLRGTLAQRLDGNVLLVEVEGQRVLVFVPPDASWPADQPEGARLEILGVMVGRQALGELHAPLLRAMWIRDATPPS